MKRLHDEFRLHPENLLSVLLILLPIVLLLGYYAENTRNVPRFDEYRAYNVVINAADNTLTWRDLLHPSSGHIAFFTFSLSALFAKINHWNLTITPYINFLLASGIFSIYAVFVRKFQPDTWQIALIPMSLLTFSLGQDLNWIITYESVWFFTIIFFLLSMLVLATAGNTYRSLLLAALIAFMATFSHGNGMFTWFAIAVYLVLSGVKDWRHWLTWIGLAAVSIGLYFYLIDLNFASPGMQDEIQDPLTLWNVVLFNLMFVGNSVLASAHPTWLLATAGMIGIVVFTLSFALLWRDPSERRGAAVWMTVIAYTLMVATALGIARIEEFGVTRAATPWYMTAANLFWIGGIGLTARAFVAYRSKTGWAWLVYLYATLAVVSLGAFIDANIKDTMILYIRSNRQMQPDCLQRYLFVQDTDVMFCNHVPYPFGPELNRLAVRRLTAFNERPPENLLPDADSQQPILVETHNHWSNIHIRDYFLAETDENRILNVFPETLGAANDTPKPLLNTLTPNDPQLNATLNEFLLSDDSFWYVYLETHETALNVFWDTLLDEGYLPTDVIESNYRIAAQRFQQAPPLLANSPRFGDAIRLRAITSVNKSVAVCDDIQLDTYWLTEQPFSVDYSANLVIVDASGNGVASSDAQLGQTFGTKDWEVNQLYGDTRAVAVPCDLAPGTYDLMLGIYFYQAPNDKLVVTGDNDAGRDDLLLIERIEVVAAQ